MKLNNDKSNESASDIKTKIAYWILKIWDGYTS